MQPETAAELEATVRDYLDPLLHPAEDAIRLDGEVDTPVRPWQGFTPTRTDQEPVDQLQSLVAANRIDTVNRNYGEAGDMVAFVADGFPALNARVDDDPYQLVEQQQPAAGRKRQMLRQVGDSLGIDIVTVTTDEVWSDQTYWDRLQEHLEQEYGSHRDMIDLMQTKRMAVGSRDGRAMPAEEVLEAIDTRYGVDAGAALSDYLSAWEQNMRPMEADILYVPAEQAVAHHLARTHDRNVKVGPRSERHYDDGIQGQGILHLPQPGALHASLSGSSAAIPYIADENDRDQRILVGDHPDTVAEKVDGADVKQVYAGDGDVRNGVVDAAMVAAELAAATGQESLQADGAELKDAYDVHRYVQERGADGVRALRDTLPSAIDRTVNDAVDYA
ncbi:MAG: hypothetical protein SVU88_01605 [Candidatus Nanohaloarchaea archaeon]|nr:hypothetical protein [Candidatus Nanohaloarchaea archaeon]